MKLGLLLDTPHVRGVDFVCVCSDVKENELFPISFFRRRRDPGLSFVRRDTIVVPEVFSPKSLGPFVCVGRVLKACLSGRF